MVPNPSSYTSGLRVGKQTFVTLMQGEDDEKQRVAVKILEAQRLCDCPESFRRGVEHGWLARHNEIISQFSQQFGGAIR